MKKKKKKFTSYHGQRIISAVVELMNNAYNEYLSSHPDFKGKVILFGHSLGGIILYDILVNQDYKKLEKFKAWNRSELKEKDMNGNSDDMNSPLEKPILSPNNLGCEGQTLGSEDVYGNDYSHITTNTNPNTNPSNFSDNNSFDSINLNENQHNKNVFFSSDDIVFPTINFYPEFLYVCGSSVSAAMIMRCQYFQDYHLPEHMIFQNIYNRTDPFAYRYEPMVDTEFQHVKPVLIKNININTNANNNNNNNNNNTNNNSNNNNSNNNNDNDSTSPLSTRTSSGNQSIFVSLRERFTNKINHQSEKSTIKSRSPSPTKSTTISEMEKSSQKDSNNNKNKLKQKPSNLSIHLKGNNTNNNTNDNNSKK